MPTYVPTNGLVGWWPFNGNANDESGNGNNGTVNGATLTADRFGVVDKAYSFDGVDDFLFVPKENQLTTFTYNTWVKLSNLNNVQHMVGNWNYNVIERTAVLYIQNGQVRGSLEFIGQPQYYILGDNIEINTWKMLTLTYDGNYVNLYINGLINSTLPGNGLFTNTQLPAFYFGSQDGTVEFLNGSLDDIGIWNRALTECEVRTLYTSGSGAITSQPSSLSVPLSSGNIAQFSVASSATSPTYQWQGNSGMGFANLSDAGQYSGTATNTLTVNNVTISNNNQQFRCIVTDGNCEDTTDVAVLTVIDDLGIEDLNTNTTKKLLKITDLNGKETPFQKNTVLLFIYEDGTVERVFEGE